MVACNWAGSALTAISRSTGCSTVDGARDAAGAATANSMATAHAKPGAHARVIFICILGAAAARHITDRTAAPIVRYFKGGRQWPLIRSQRSKCVDRPEISV